VIAAGMVQAREVDGGLLPVADGYCYALRQAGRRGRLSVVPARARRSCRRAAAVDLGARRAASTLLFGIVLFMGDRAHRSAARCRHSATRRRGRQRALRRADPAAAGCPNSIR
jgi:hypothetical protein